MATLRKQTTLAWVAALLAVCGSCGPTERAARDVSQPAAAAVVAGADGLPRAEPADVGMSAEGLAHIRPAVRAFVDDGRLPGIVTMVARGGRIVHWQAVGLRDIEADDPLEPDDIFRIYSMSKPITSTAIMMLADSGDLALEDPVSKFIPAFADLTVLEADGSRVPAKREVTIRDLLSHTGGLTYGLFSDTPVDRLYRESSLFESASHEAFVATLADLPLLAHPGESWKYSVSTDVLGYLIQVVSGQPFGDFLEKRIFEPLGMDDTAFWVPPEKRNRFTVHYRTSEEGLEVADSPDTGRYTQAPSRPSGGLGLVSTASDYLRFGRMLLEGGQLDGARILEPETVEEMWRDHLPDGTPLPGWFLPGYGFGLGFAMRLDHDRSADAAPVGVIRWAGLAHTFFWIDPRSDLIMTVWAQIEPYGLYDLDQQFETLVYAAIDDPRP